MDFSTSSSRSINKDRTLSVTEVEAQFIEALRDANIPPADPSRIVASGKLERFDVEGDRTRSENGWYKLHADGRPNAVFGCNKRHTGQEFTWKPRGVKYAQMSENELAEMQAREIARKEKAAADHAHVAELADDMWNKAKVKGEAWDGTHAYLTSKGIDACGARLGDFPVIDKDTGEIKYILRDALLLQVRDFDKKIHTLQAIPAKPGEDGKFPKLYLTGGAKRGHFFPIGQPKRNRDGTKRVFLVCEGFATGCSLHAATGHAVVVAFDAGGLQPAAEEIRARFSDSEILICADNDAWTLAPIRNPGVHHASKAAAAVGGKIAIPEFDNLDGRPTDFNDLHVRRGDLAVAEIIEAAMAEPVETEQRDDVQDVPARARDGAKPEASLADDDQHKGVQGARMGELGAPSEIAIEIAESIEAQLTAALRGDPQDPYVFDMEKLRLDAWAIDRMLTGTFWSGAKSKLYLLNGDQSLVQFTEANAFKFLRKAFGEPVDHVAIAELVDDAVNAMKLDKEQEKLLRRRVSLIPPTAILDHIKFHLQRDEIEWRCDMFAAGAKMEMLERRARITLAHKPFHVHGEPDPEIIADYKAHFPQFDEYLEFIVKGRFALDRKKAFLWMHAESDWGKGFLIGVLDELGTTVGLSVKEIEAMFEGKPVGRSPQDFCRAFALVFDEFKHVKAELKQVQSKISLAPKHQLTAEVEVFAKLFFSAEGVESLVTEHGVEDQFANRISYFTGAGSLVGRASYAKVGNPVYFASVLAYTAQALNRMVEEMQAMGRLGSQTHAARYLDTFNVEHSIGKQFGRFSEEMPKVAADFRSWIERHRGYLVREGMLTEGGSGCYLHNANKVLDTYLGDHFNQSQVHAFRRKKPEILKALSADGKGCIAHRCDAWKGEPKKAVKLQPMKPGMHAPEDSDDRDHEYLFG